MISSLIYQSPAGKIYLESLEDALTCVSIEGQDGFKKEVTVKSREEAPEILQSACNWLDAWFQGENPDWLPRIFWKGTAFQQLVWQCLLEIPYGSITTYGEIARKLSSPEKPRMSAQAVGQAVGRNPISILVPCHRVMGGGGKVTGYNGGTQLKKQLLQIEGSWRDEWILLKEKPAVDKHSK